MTFAPDNVHDAVLYGLQEISTLDRVDGGVRVTTLCMYPSNSLVRVTVRGGNRILIASDEGAALAEAQSAGIPMIESNRALQSLVRDQGLLVRSGVILTPEMPLDAAALAIMLVANASRDAANFLFERAKIKPTRDFKALLAQFLKKKFDDRVHSAEIVGSSNKLHKFPNVISLSDGRRLIVDPVVNDASSINARVIANMDVKSTGDSTIIQRIVYDDADAWSPANLNLLNVGATAVPFSRSEEVIERVAAVG